MVFIVGKRKALEDEVEAHRTLGREVTQRQDETEFRAASESRTRADRKVKGGSPKFHRGRNTFPWWKWALSAEVRP